VITLGQTTYSATIGRAGGIALGGGNVYVSEYVGGTTNSGYIEQCPTTGCPGTPPKATLLFTDAGNAGLGQIIYDSGSSLLYFGDGNQGRTYAINLSGNQVFLVGDAAYGIATDSTNLYLGDSQGIGYVSKTTGGPVTRIISTIGYTVGVAVDPNTGNIWGAAHNNNFVVHCPLGGACSQWTWTGGPGAVAVVGLSPYILTSSSGFYRCASDSDCTQANATQLTTQGGSNFSNDASYAYLEFGAAVQRCSLSAGCAAGPQTIAGAAGNVAWTAVDSTWVYWLTDNGYIQKVAK
jgi:hypothetical protein